MDDAGRRRLAGAGAFLWERLAGGHVAEDDPADEAAKVLRCWIEALGDGDRERFAARLALEGIDRTRVMALLGPVRLAEDQPLPAWVAQVEALVAEVGRDGRGGAVADQPFAHLWRGPVAALAASWAADPDLAILTHEARQAAADRLLEELCHAAAPVLLGEFSFFRSFLPAAEPGSTALYDEFIDQLRSGRIADLLLREYAPLARLLAGLRADADAALREFAARFAADREALCDLCGGVPARVLDIEPGLGDPHQGGRRVMGVVVEVDGHPVRLIYKPRPVAMEAAYAGLLAWLDERGLTPSLRAVRVLDRGSYGWEERVATGPCTDAEAVRRFDLRLGMHLALLTVLRGRDLHAENLLACGEQPVFPDLEVLLAPSPRLAAEDLAGADGSARGALADSPLDTGILPAWELGRDGASRDISAVGGGAGGPDHGRQARRWREVNTDRMHRASGPVELPVLPNRPLLDGRRQALNRTALLDGFTRCMELLARTPDLPLEAFARAPVRYLFRGSQAYADLVRVSIQPEVLTSGAARSAAIDRLARVAAAFPQNHRFIHLLPIEREAIARLDIPVLWVRADDDAFPLPGGGSVPEFLREPAIAAVRRRLATMDAAHIGMQAALVSAALDCDATPAGGSQAPVPAAEQPLTAEQAVSVAHRLAGRILDHAIRGADGSLTWIGPCLSHAHDRHVLRPLVGGLFDGLAGIGLFLAGAAAAGGDERCVSAARAVFGPLRQALPGLAALAPGRVPLGGCTGLPSIAHALALTGTLLGQRQVVDEAATALAALTREQIDADQGRDVVQGAAGAILCLLAVARRAEAPTLIERAVWCGDALLACREADGSWRSLPTVPPLCGFSHGAAGYAVALARLAAASGEARFATAAREAIRWEDRHLRPGRVGDASAAMHIGNWPDLRLPPDRDGRRSCALDWAHGGPGIAAARLAGMAAVDGTEVRRDLDSGLEVARLAGVGWSDDLCNGTCGRIDVLLDAPLDADRSLARRLAAAMVQRAGSKDAFAGTGGEGLPRIGLFPGLAGIGWTLLRCADSLRFPSILRWD